MHLKSRSVSICLNDILHLKFQDLVVGYMGVPKYSGISMTQHPQYVTVRYHEIEK